MPLEEKLKIGDLIRDLRHQLGLSQEKFAARLGVSYLTVHRWENSQTKPSPMAIKLIEAELKLMGDRGQTLLNRHRSTQPGTEQV